MGEMESAVRADLERWGIGEDTGLAAQAIDLARRLDASGVRPAAASMLHAQLRPVLADLAKAAAENPAEDGIDELRARRARRTG